MHTVRYTLCGLSILVVLSVAVGCGDEEAPASDDSSADVLAVDGAAEIGIDAGSDVLSGDASEPWNCTEVGDCQATCSALDSACRSACLAKGCASAAAPLDALTTCILTSCASSCIADPTGSACSTCLDDNCDVQATACEEHSC